MPASNITYKGKVQDMPHFSPEQRPFSQKNTDAKPYGHEWLYDPDIPAPNNRQIPAEVLVARYTRDDGTTLYPAAWERPVIEASPKVEINPETETDSKAEARKARLIATIGEEAARQLIQS